ncbi:hypothetical protein MPDQ_007022 [Monascus purpureus]|uniref:DUF7704 domain-containing protein n=1 Tax=Monascus purpureus TaxID=5098 RepID=A0A507QSZ7_MONPU|nr:hypothetical protein MPDQ_007022 [Monascus purpureus]
MSTLFPRWPHILFGIFEPISLLLGWAAPLVDLDSFIAGQTPKVAAPTSLHPSSVALAYQLGNVYLLLLLVGVGVCYTTSEPKVLRNYLIALAIADVGHIYATYVAMRWEAFVDVSSWNVLTWGNIGASGFLFVNRIAYLMGVFGYPKRSKGEVKRS